MRVWHGPPQGLCSANLDLHQHEVQHGGAATWCLPAAKLLPRQEVLALLDRQILRMAHPPAIIGEVLP